MARIDALFAIERDINGLSPDARRKVRRERSRPRVDALEAWLRQHYAKLWGTGMAETKRRVEERVPLGRYIEPSEVAAAAAWILGPDGRAVTGTPFVLDLGWTAH